MIFQEVNLELLRDRPVRICSGNELDCNTQESSSSHRTVSRGNDATSAIELDCSFTGISELVRDRPECSRNSQISYGTILTTILVEMSDCSDKRQIPNDRWTSR